MADAKISALTELAATPTTGDLFAIVDDPAGTPVTKKITVDNVSNFVAADTQTFTNKTIDANGTGNSITNIDLTADIINTLPVANGGTGVTSSTGTGNTVLSTSPTFVTPVLGTPASGVATNLTGTAAGLTAGAVSTITGLAPDTATTQATQPNITSMAAMPWTGMKTGVDGEIPTFDAAGAPAFVAVGTSGQVLKSNGVGAAPTFQADAAGLTGTTIKTIGASGDYSDVAAFVAGESTPYHAVLVSDVTEDSNIAIDGIFVLDLDRYTLTMGDNEFTYAGAAQTYVFGKGVDSGAEIDWTHTDGTRLFDNASIGNTDILSIRDCVLDNNSTATNGGVAVDGIQHIENVRLDCANILSGGFGFFDDGSTFRNITFVGGGTSCEGVLNGAANNRALYDNLQFTGTFIVGASADLVATFGEGAATNIYFEHATDRVAIKVNGCVMTNVICDGTEELDIFSGAGVNKLTNIQTNGGAIDLDNDAQQQLTNVHCASIDLTDASSSQSQYTNVYVSVSAVTLGGDNNKFINCVFLGGVASVASGANDNGFTNCQFGAEGGAGALTLTITSGSNRTRVIGCMTDAAISDSGTDSVLVGNTVY